MPKQILYKKLQDFFDIISSLQHHQRILKDSIHKEIAELFQRRDKLNSLNDEERELFSVSHHVFYFYNPLTGYATPYESKKTSIEERAKLLHIHKNKQYQWILAEAYEAFEDYIEWMYACAGFIDPTFWQAGDFGEISISDIASKDIDWFHQRALAKKSSPKSIISHFRKKLPELDRLEKDNKTNTNLRLSISIIENLRHVIVHKNGKVSNKEAFIEKILKESCLFKDRKNEESAIARINELFGNGAHENLVVLVENSVPGGLGILQINHHANLISDLLGYSFLLTNFLDQYLFPESHN